MKTIKGAIVYFDYCACFWFMFSKESSLERIDTYNDRFYSFLHNLLISSRLFPLVSGTSFQTKRAAMIQMAP